MKEDRLKPYVHKVKGACNFALYDVLNGNLYQIVPNSSIREIRKMLFDAGLIFETKGVVPNKLMMNMIDIRFKIHIRSLQIRLNGCSEDTCWGRKKNRNRKKYMQIETLEKLKNECTYIPIKKIIIEAECDEREMIKKILTEFVYDEIELRIEQGIQPKNLDLYKDICYKNNKLFSFSQYGNRKIREFEVDLFKFSYCKLFNPCLGHQIAIDSGGDIKYCLWSEEVLGNILKNNLKDMIIAGMFDKYWELSKDKIDICKDCEFRYACNDCRVSAVKDSNNIKAIPSFCKYDPYEGKEYK